MSENKLDRGNLRRQAQRVESYKSLITRQRSTWKSNTPLRRVNSFEEAPKTDTLQFPPRDIEEDQTSRGDQVSSPGNSTPSPSSDSSQDFRLNFCSSLKAIQNMPYQSEREGSSVMTRSATRKYASVGAIHNRVDIDRELRVTKRWPRHVSYPLPNPPDDLLQLRDVVTRSFNQVLTFCKTAVVPENSETHTESEENVLWTSQETADNIIDLSPYLTQESVSTDSDGNHITFHLNEDYITHPFVNILALNDDEHEGTLVIHEDQGEYETITLHSGETYLVDNNKYFSNTTGSQSNLNDPTLGSHTFPEDPMIAIYNDHTYAAKPNENFIASENLEIETSPKPQSVKNEEDEFKLENALNDLLLNTAILKCLVCNETPQEIMSQLDIAQSYLYSGDGLL